MQLFVLSCTYLRMRQARAVEPTWFTHSFRHRLRKFVSRHGESRMFCKVGPMVVKTTCWAECSWEMSEEIQVLMDVRLCRLLRQSKLDYYPLFFFFPTRMCITVFTTASRWKLSWGRWIQSTSSHPTHLRIVRVNVIHLTMYGSPKRFLPFGISYLNCVCISHISEGCYMSHLACFVHCDLIDVVLHSG